jgi:hypothetical protein
MAPGEGATRSLGSLCVMRVLSEAPARRNLNRACNGTGHPYGCYFTASGEIVLFDRRYRPMFRLDRHGRVSADDPARWVGGIIGKCWFHDDSCSPRRNPEIRHRVSILAQRWQAAADGVDVPISELLPPAWIFNRKPPLAA